MLIAVMKNFERRILFIFCKSGFTHKVFFFFWFIYISEKSSDFSKRGDRSGNANVTTSVEECSLRASIYDSAVCGSQKIKFAIARA